MELLNPFNLSKKYEQVFISQNIGFENEEFFLLKDSNQIIFLVIAPPNFGHPDIPNYYVYQLEIPLKAISWLIDSIENKFWNSAKEGGLPSGQYKLKEVVVNETLALYREMNVGAKNQKGFRLANFSRPSRKFDDNFQEFFITDALLIDGGLLDKLKLIQI
ncbi:hypothetical protein L1264_12615 [Pseudoalteromonas sp. APAL1]|uniref:hypothetical protein n=1 Tax=Pseudoalteromonas TaxID=53246 RepID=UPI000EF092DF|nr:MULTISPECIES: hypothetical protein [unclassified Pseudoalteromonas]MCF2921319.1 hypothetical protein [Pseudoalteromonas sp. APAL1]HCV01536.1 hypothetical protein [Pseudoalteromonas sp.]|tara:strand:+ start:476 stop:958 length:483 start_codon:yes stop_codon:yes gene_type:complete